MRIHNHEMSSVALLSFSPYYWVDYKITKSCSITSTNFDDVKFITSVSVLKLLIILFEFAGLDLRAQFFASF